MSKVVRDIVSPHHRHDCRPERKSTRIVLTISGFLEVGDVSAVVNGMKDGARNGVSYHVTAVKMTEMAPPMDKPTISNGESRQQWNRYLTVL